MVLPECPEELRYLLPYLQRASELKGREPLIAYYCGYYAANLALTKGYIHSKENDAFLNSLLDSLEEEKQQLSSDSTMNDAEKARNHIMQFAMKIFLAADNEDRSGQATKKTGRLFLVASQFLEVMRTFGNLPEEIEERIKYAKWKASDIVRAINEGKKPQPGPPHGNNDGSIDITKPSSPPIVSSPTQNSNADPTSIAPTLPSLSGQFPPSASIIQSSRMDMTLDTRVSSSSPPSMAPIVQDISPPVSPVLDPSGLAQAEKYARYAVSAIQFEDVPTALQNLELCMNTLRSLQRR